MRIAAILEIGVELTAFKSCLEIQFSPDIMKLTFVPLF